MLENFIESRKFLQKPNENTPQKEKKNEKRMRWNVIQICGYSITYVQFKTSQLHDFVKMD